MASATDPDLAASLALPVPGEVEQHEANPTTIAIDNFSVCIIISPLATSILTNLQDESNEFDSDFSDVTSLSSSVLQYEYENGRRYHSNSVVRASQSSCYIPYGL